MTDMTITSLQAWICPEHGIVDQDSVKRTQDDDYCLNEHRSPQTVSLLEVVPITDLQEARAANTKIVIERDRWQKQFTDARLELADVKARSPQQQSDITTEAAANLVAEARSALREAENDAKAWKDTALKARDRGNVLEAKLNELESVVPVDSDITTEAAAGLVAQARSAQEAAERDRDRWQGKANELRDRAAEIQEQLDNELARVRPPSDITSEAASNLVSEARAAQAGAERDRDAWKAKSKEWLTANEALRIEADELRTRLANQDSDITTEAAANLVAEARSAQALIEKERDELKAQVNAWRDRYAGAMRQIDVKPPPPVDTDITTEAAANLVAEARSAQQAAERERDDLQIERDQWKRRYGEARSERIPARVSVDDSIKVEATTNLLTEARSALAVAERERDEAKLEARRWRQHYGEARAETTAAERQLTRDDSADQLRAKREQLAEIDAVARDARNFLAVADVPKSQDDQRRSILRRLRSAVS